MTDSPWTPGSRVWLGSERAERGLVRSDPCCIPIGWVMGSLIKVHKGERIWIQDRDILIIISWWRWSSPWWAAGRVITPSPPPVIADNCQAGTCHVWSRVSCNALWYPVQCDAHCWDFSLGMCWLLVSRIRSWCYSLQDDDSELTDHYRRWGARYSKPDPTPYSGQILHWPLTGLGTTW